MIPFLTVAAFGCVAILISMLRAAINKEYELFLAWGCAWIWLMVSVVEKSK